MFKLAALLALVFYVVADETIKTNNQQPCFKGEKDSIILVRVITNLQITNTIITYFIETEARS